MSGACVRESCRLTWLISSTSRSGRRQPGRYSRDRGRRRDRGRARRHHERDPQSDPEAAGRRSDQGQHLLYGGAARISQPVCAGPGGQGPQGLEGSSASRARRGSATRSSSPVRRVMLMGSMMPCGRCGRGARGWLRPSGPGRTARCRARGIRAAPSRDVSLVRRRRRWTEAEANVFGDHRRIIRYAQGCSRRGPRRPAPRPRSAVMPPRGHGEGQAGIRVPKLPAPPALPSGRRRSRRWSPATAATPTRSTTSWPAGRGHGRVGLRRQGEHRRAQRAPGGPRWRHHGAATPTDNAVMRTPSRQGGVCPQEAGTTR